MHAHFTPQHRPLCHLGSYEFDFVCAPSTTCSPRLAPWLSYYSRGLRPRLAPMAQDLTPRVMLPEPTPRGAVTIHEDAPTWLQDGWC